MSDYKAITYALVLTRDKEKYLQSRGYRSLLDKVSYIEVMEGATSIFDEVDSVSHIKGLCGEDTLLLIHDDVEILSDKNVFKYCMDTLDIRNAGFIGLAGTQLLGESGIWWEGLGNYTPRSPRAGAVYHGEDYENMSLTQYGPGNRRKVVVMDGLFLAAKVKTWRNIRTKMPSEFTGKWDFYDIYYTFQAHMKELNNYVVPLSVLHSSPGDTRGREGWHSNRKAFTDKYKKHLPCTIK